MKTQTSYFVYIVKCSDKTYYTGITDNLKLRIKEHNGEKTGGAKYTRGRRPVKLIHSEKFPSRSDAAKREYEIKKLKRKDKEKILKI